DGVFRHLLAVNVGLGHGLAVARRILDARASATKAGLRCHGFDLIIAEVSGLADIGSKFVPVSNAARRMLQFPLPLEPGWDAPSLREFAARLAARREPRPREDRTPRGAVAVEWFLGHVEPATDREGTIRERFERPTGDIPGSVKIAMND